MIRPNFTKADVGQVCARYPNLFANGFHDSPQDTLLTDEYVRQTNICALLIDAHFSPAKRLWQASSYGLKSIVEIATGKYVCDGAFIAAAILLGYAPTRGRGSYPSAFFRFRISKTLREYMHGQLSELPLPGGADT